VPNISLGAPIVQSLRRVNPSPSRDTHDDLGSRLFLEEFVEAGSDSFLVHWKVTTTCIARFGGSKNSENAQEWSVNPATPAAVLEEILPEVDQVLV